MKKTQLQTDFEYSVSKYIHAFELKQDLSFEFWIADRIGEVATFGDIFIFDFSDIRFDIDTDQPKDNILKWNDIQMDLHEKKKQTFNYSSWCMGLRKV